MSETVGSSPPPGELLAAILQVMIVMMIIDQDLDAAEVDAVRASYERLTGEHPDDVVVQKVIDEASVEAVSAHLRAIVRQITPDQRKMIVRAALMVATADGHMRDVEYEYVTMVARDVMVDDDEIREIWGELSS